jgi:hypothetical protein
MDSGFRLRRPRNDGRHYHRSGVRREV